MTTLIIGLISNLAGVMASKYLISGLNITDDWIKLAIVVVLLTVANSIVLPVLRFIFKPLSFLTLGLFAFALNAAMIYLVDFFSEDITISGLLPLIYATIIIGAINATFAYFAKVLKNNRD